MAIETAGKRYFKTLPWQEKSFCYRGISFDMYDHMTLTDIHIYFYTEDMGRSGNDEAKGKKARCRKQRLRNE